MFTLHRLISGTSFAQFGDFVTPAFFQVMPMGKLLLQARALVSAYRDRSFFADACAQRARALEASSLPIDLVAQGAAKGSAPELPEERKAMGELVLALYFHQIMSSSPAIMDMSKARLHYEGKRLIWAPGPGHVVWDERFRSAIANVYRCFYTDAQASTLSEALVPLGLETAADIFLRHFGDGAQREVVFRVSNFVASFHAIFVHCKERGITLHPQFLPLGLCLASLYETLEALDVPLDVRAAFDRVATASQASHAP